MAMERRAEWHDMIEGTLTRLRMETYLSTVTTQSAVELLEEVFDQKTKAKITRSLEWARWFVS